MDKNNSFYRICDKLTINWFIILDIYIKNFQAVETREKNFNCIQDLRWQKAMTGPNIKVLINIDFQNLDLWTFLGSGWGGGLRETSMGCFWLQNRFVSLPLLLQKLHFIMTFLRQIRSCLGQHVDNNKRGIFARRAMVDQAREGLCYQRET